MLLVSPLLVSVSAMRQLPSNSTTSTRLINCPERYAHTHALVVGAQVGAQRKIRKRYHGLYQMAHKQYPTGAKLLLLHVCSYLHRGLVRTRYQRCFVLKISCPVERTRQGYDGNSTRPAYPVRPVCATHEK